jgi:hypothetical protein
MFRQRLPRLLAAVAVLIGGLSVAAAATGPSAQAKPDCDKVPTPPICERTTTTARRTTTTRRADPTDNLLVWRLQVRLVIGDVDDAGSDDDVEVILNPGSVTWLDSPANDFERNTSRIYDLPLDGVGRMADISQLFLTKTGDDGMCLSRVELVVNNRLAFSQAPPTASGPCRWLDSDGSGLNLVFSGTQLRADANWLAFQQPTPPLVIPAAEWRSRIEGIVGNSIATNSLYWGDISGEAVELAGNGSALHVDLDLAADVTILPDPGVDIDFDLVFSCDVDNKLLITSTNLAVDVDSSIVWEVLTLDLIEIMDTKVDHAVTKGFKAITATLDTPVCPTVIVQPDGTVVLLPF